MSIWLSILWSAIQVLLTREMARLYPLAKDVVLAIAKDPGLITNEDKRRAAVIMLKLRFQEAYATEPSDSSLNLATEWAYKAAKVFGLVS